MDWRLIFDTALTQGFGPQAIVVALAAIGLNVQFGYAGLLNFGQVAFLAVGAYSIAMGVDTFGLNFWLCVFLALLSAVVLALLLGFPTLRLRTDYLAIVTIAAGEIIRLVLRAGSYRGTTGGAAGIQNFADDFFEINPFPRGSNGIGFVDYSSSDLWVMTVGWGLVAASCLMIFLLIRSPWGRVVKAIREDEDAVRSLGKNVYLYKMQALILGGVIGAVGGMIFAIDRQSIVPDSLGTQRTFFAYTALILGGSGRVGGPVVGAIVFTFLTAFTDTTLRELVENNILDKIPLLPSDLLVANEVGIAVQILVGLGLMALMIFRPQGIFGDKREVAISARR
ncbi:MAG: branched-chain amino acid ABC transporter permease [Actinomycetota bacterium]|nr:branched-chain amino acid ABC transporter permease [Acidimicrobiia bacterium]MDQ3293294.1 branched-chain amino acid ABC transporter permease [Actinomycetota bacterium]